MHASLTLDNLSGVPSSYQTIATRAAHGSLDDLRRLLDEVKLSRDLVVYLPVLYANLTPAPRIPSRGRELLSNTNSRAILAISAVQDIKYLIPKPAFEHLWPLVWKWSSFLHAHQDAIPDAPSLALVDTNLLCIMSAFYNDFAALISRTSGVRDLLVRSWTLFIEAPEAAPGSYMATLYHFLQRIKIADPPNLDEFIAAAGGSIEDVAILLKLSLDYGVQRGQDGLWIGVVLAILTDVDSTADSRTMTALVDSGIIVSLINVLSMLRTSANLMILRRDEFAGLVLAALQLLQRLLTHSSTERTLRPAVGAGLLQAIVFCARRNIGGQFTNELLRNVLPLCTLYHSVHPGLADVMRELGDACEVAFNTTASLDLWTYFRDLNRERLRLFVGLRRRRKTSHRACGDMECGQIHFKTRFRRCSGCHAVYYCSADCQRADWHRGGHRNQCAPTRASVIENREHLTPRNESFLRAIVQEDYKHYQRSVLAAQLAATRLHPSTPLVTIFSYANGDPHFSAQPPRALMETFPHLNWNDALARAGRSGGRMEVHLVVIPLGEGEPPMAWLFALRSNISSLHEELRRVAVMPNLSSTDVDTELTRLLGTCRRGLEQIHQ
ncbi:hypothetical protein C8R46DRAFT_655664 [Mycena filopes]|nr:hypothetical protein C8R46DRAFT_655664 [Mycena filopes]